jgi:ubiquinone/menaquinone biosynthesis C-methylase UbiE
MRDIALKALFDSPEGDLLDVCCGPGWFCLESARAGRNVTGYDISNKALELANYVKTENSASIAGEITYINKSAEDVDFIGGNFSGVMGWSAFHHLKNPGKFLDHIYSALPHGGIVVTMDDLDSDVPSRIMRYLFKLLLPIYEYTYFQKIKFIFNLLIGRAKLNKMMESPMEIYSDKHGDAAAVIRDKLVNKFVPIYDVQFGAFSVFVGHSLKGPKFFRYAMAWFVTKVDSVLCALRICKGSYRIIVSVKR